MNNDYFDLKGKAYHWHNSYILLVNLMIWFLKFLNFLSIRESREENQYDNTDLSDSLSSQGDNDLTTIEFEKQVIEICS